MQRSIGEKFERARIEAGFSNVDEVHEKTGLSRNFIYQIERIGNGKNAANPTLAVMMTLANAYNRPLGDFFETSDAGPEMAPLTEAIATFPEDRRPQVVRTVAGMISTLISAISSNDSRDTLPENSVKGPRVLVAPAVSRDAEPQQGRSAPKNPKGKDGRSGHR